MRCVPTCAVMEQTDPELACARQQLRERLSLLARCLSSSGDAMPDAEPDAPWREDDGTIVYIHGFRHARLTLGGGPFTMAILSSPGWWPIGCGHRAPRRTAPRGQLRLVS